MECRITHVETGLWTRCRAPDIESAARIYWREPVEVRNIVEVSKGCTHADAHKKITGEYLGKMEVVEEPFPDYRTEK